jgi:hypothetical protein
MKKTALLTGALCAITSAGAFAQSSSVIVIPAFENRFAGIHSPVVALHTINRGGAFQSQTFGGSTFTTDPAARGVVSSPTAAATRGRLDPTVQNIPVFPGNTVLMQQGGFGFGFGQSPFMFPPNAGFGNTGTFIQQGGGSSLQEVDPFRTTATPGPAVNAVPNPAAPVPTIPQLQPTTGTTIPVQQQNPITIVPGTPIQTQPTGSGQGQQQGTPNSPAAPQNNNR